MMLEAGPVSVSEKLWFIGPAAAVETAWKGARRAVAAVNEGWMEAARRVEVCQPCDPLPTAFALSREDVWWQGALVGRVLSWQSGAARIPEICWQEAISGARTPGCTVFHVVYLHGQPHARITPVHAAAGLSAHEVWVPQAFRQGDEAMRPVSQAVTAYLAKKLGAVSELPAFVASALHHPETLRDALAQQVWTLGAVEAWWTLVGALVGSFNATPSQRDELGPRRVDGIHASVLWSLGQGLPMAHRDVPRLADLVHRHMRDVFDTEVVRAQSTPEGYWDTFSFKLEFLDTDNAPHAHVRMAWQALPIPRQLHELQDGLLRLRQKDLATVDRFVTTHLHALYHTRPEWTGWREALEVLLHANWETPDLKQWATALARQNHLEGLWKTDQSEEDRKRL